MFNAEIDTLKKAIESQYGGTATYTKTAKVRETWQGKTVWSGVVHLFGLAGHPLANRAYAWSEPVEDSDRRGFYAALHVAPVDSPKAAVRASIVQRHRH